MAKCAIAIGQYKYVLRSGPEGCGGLMIRMPRPTSLNLSLARGGVDSETCLSHGMNSHPSSTARATEAGIVMRARLAEEGRLLLCSGARRSAARYPVPFLHLYEYWAASGRVVTAKQDARGHARAPPSTPSTRARLLPSHPRCV